MIEGVWAHLCVFIFVCVGMWVCVCLCVRAQVNVLETDGAVHENGEVGRVGLVDPCCMASA